MAVINSAYTERFRSNFKTSTGRTWQVQIFDRKCALGGLGVPPYDFEITDGGLTFQYDCDGDEKFAPIVGCKATLNFMVDTSDLPNYHGMFIDDLLGISGSAWLPYSEGDLVMVVRKGPGNAGTILFVGEYLMDLDTLPDVAGVYPIQLTFTDGLGKLKEIEFKSENVDSSLEEYRNMGHKRFTYWIGQILQHTKKFKTAANPQGFWDSAANKVAFRTCVRWWNADFYRLPSSAAVKACPLYQTKGTVKWADKYNPSKQSYQVATAYEVLKQICRSWGMRVIYWNGNYWFTQIFEFDTTDWDDSGNFPASSWSTPIDNYSARWYADGDPYSSMQPSMGNNMWSRFKNEFHNITSPAERIQKLQGTTYKFLPVLREVETNLVHEGFQNIFPGFPQPNGYATNFNEFLGGPFLNSSQFKYQTTLVVSVTAGTHWILNNGYNLLFYMQIFALDNVSNPTLANNALATLSYDPVANTYGWDDTPTYSGLDTGPVIPLNSGNGPHPGSGATSFVQLLPDLKFPGYRDAATKYGIAILSPAYTITTGGTYVNISTGGAYGSSAISTYTNPTDSSALTPPAWSTGLYNNFISTIQPISNQSATTNTILINSNADNSHKLDWGDVFWGDGPEYWDNSALLVESGNGVFTFSDWTSKDWKRMHFTQTSNPTANSGDTFEELLMKQMKECQSRNIKRATWSGINSELGLDLYGKPYFINPMGVIEDCNVDSANNVLKTRYFFRRGTYDVMRDQWEGEWIETETEAVTGSVSMRIGGGTNLQGRGQMEYERGGGTYQGQRARISVLSSQVGIVKDVAITSLSIGTPNGDMVLGTNYNLKTGDKVYLTYRTGTTLEVVLTADLTAESTSISFESITPSLSSDGPVMIQLPLFDMWEQGNRKTRGQVAGFDVSATGLTKGGITINEFLDSDTMEGASATKLSTSESIKAYADTKQGALSLTTTGTSGASTLVGNTLNIPQYSGGGGTTQLKNASVRPSEAQSISSGGSVGSKSNYTVLAIDTNILGGSVMSPFTLSSGNLRISEAGTYLVNFSFTSTVSGTANRTLAGAHLYKRTSGSEEWVAVDGTQVYNYDRGTASGSGASTWGTVYEGSGASSAIINIESLEDSSVVDLQIGFWIDGRATSASGITTIPDGCVLNIVKIK